MRKINFNVYADSYVEGTLVKSVLDKKFGFELEIITENQMLRQIISYDEVKDLQKKIEKALEELEVAKNYDSKQGKVKITQPDLYQKIRTHDLKEDDKYLVSFDQNQEEIRAANINDIDIANIRTVVSRLKTKNGREIVVNVLENSEEIKNDKSMLPDYDMKIIEEALK